LKELSPPLIQVLQPTIRLTSARLWK
jgi:hypothetical protein